ncbi:MAG TPA: LacI family DNA-binding transcriptional regulator [Armatimonadota bacterium]|nr:LacI family DNA-binding transcriptional regulator [Armatimonadota bacterium]
MDSTLKPRTIGELAARLGVSPMTIHRAIAGKPDISPKTRTRILDEIERLGWRPNIAARGLRQGKTFTIGILVTNVAASFLPEILQSVNRRAEELGSHTLVCVHDNEVARAEQHLKTLHSKGVDGIVYYPAGGEDPQLLNQIHRTTPIVTIMREVEGFNGRSVMIDDRLGGRLAAEHLLRLGHRRVGFLGYRDSPFSTFRREGYAEALRAAGVSLPPKWTVEELVPGDAVAVLAAERLLAGSERPTALFCASDRLAARTIQAAASLGLRVPADLSVIGFNGDAWGALLTPPLTTVVQPRAQVGERAARIVLGLETGESERSILEPWLVERASTGTTETIELPLVSRI